MRIVAGRHLGQLAHAQLTADIRTVVREECRVASGDLLKLLACWELISSMCV